jgi:3-oxoacyl-[acyl-carrier protein] reductase
MDLSARQRWPGIAGRIALVTGASRGIGRTVAEALARQGAVVIGTGTSEAGAESITKMLGSLGLPGRGAVLDVADAASVERLLEDIGAREGAPTILVNNAGITRDNLLMRMKQEEWDDVISTNLSSLYRVCKACVRGMIKAKSGAIVNIASVVGLTGNPGQSNYAAAKAGMIGFSKALAREVASRNITVNVVAPGLIATDMTKAITEHAQGDWAAQIPLGRPGSTADVAAAVCFLASDEASYITGQVLAVNGGMYM